MKNFNPIRGCDDFMPRQAFVRNNVKRTILASYQKNGYNLISTPILENLELLSSSEGGDNLRLMFKTIKRGDKLDLTKPNLSEQDIVEEGLRYDLTVPLARFYANNREKLPTPFKSIQIDYSFRAERPQKGRARQFIQCDIDVFGDPSINAELDLIYTAIQTYEAVGLNNLTVKINHRQILNSIVLFSGFAEQDISTICVTLDKLDKISVSGVVLELIEKGFDPDKINNLVDVINDLEANGLAAVKKYGKLDQVVAELEFLIGTLNKLFAGRHNINFDISIVRGQGYYTGAVFEVYTQGFAGAIGGGGRYDKMLEKFTGITCPAVGYGLGFEPVCLLVEEKLQKVLTNQLVLLYDANDNILDVYKVKEELKKNYSVSLFLKPKNLKNFYEKIGSVADFSISVADYLAGKEIKKL